MKGVNTEVRNRVRVTIAAYAYELKNDPVMSDAKFDRLAGQVNLDVATDRPDLDDFFHRWFTPDTGMWIHHHPELDKLEGLYQMLKDHQPKTYDQKNNLDLFGPLLVEPVQRREACKRCGGDIFTFPANGGCYC